MGEPLLLALLLTGQTVLIDRAPAPELAVLEAVVTQAPTWTVKCKLARVSFARPERWARAREPSGRWFLSTLESPAPKAVSDDFVNAIEEANRSVVLLDAMRIPEGLAWASDGPVDPCVFRLSRPGISADDTRALVDIYIESPPCRCPRGHVVYLERRTRWVVVAEGGHWLTECVCTLPSDKK